MYGYIYRITDLTNGKCYIGQHKHDKPELDPKYHGSGVILKNKIKKHPKDFLEEILFIAATPEELNYFEEYFIEHLNTLYPNGYNLKTGGDCGILSEESRKKISKKLKGMPAPPTAFKKGSTPWNKGKKSYAAWNKGLPKESQPRFKYISYDVLYELRITQHKTIKEISDILNVYEGTIQRKCKEYNINSNNHFKPIIQYDISGKYIAEYSSLTSACNALGYKIGPISNCLRGKMKTAYGYIWKFKQINK